VSGDTRQEIPPRRLADYERLIATQPGLKRKGATMPYTSVNGHMFSFISPSGQLALRLPAAEREAFIERYATKLHEAHGTVMKEYVTVPEPIFANAVALEPWFAASYAYVSGLKAKTRA
jgi:hypothetical protein